MQNAERRIENEEKWGLILHSTFCILHSLNSTHEESSEAPSWQTPLEDAGARSLQGGRGIADRSARMDRRAASSHKQSGHYRSRYVGRSETRSCPVRWQAAAARRTNLSPALQAEGISH